MTIGPFEETGPAITLFICTPVNLVIVFFGVHYAMRGVIAMYPRDSRIIARGLWAVFVFTNDEVFRWIIPVIKSSAEALKRHIKRGLQRTVETILEIFVHAISFRIESGARRDPSLANLPDNIIRRRSRHSIHDGVLLDCVRRMDAKDPGALIRWNDILTMYKMTTWSWSKQVE